MDIHIIIAFTTLCFVFWRPQNELLSFRGSLEEQQHIAESAQAEIEDKERSELELKVELDIMKEELERLRCSEDTLQTRVAGKDKKIAHLEEKIIDLKESKQKRADAVSVYIKGQKSNGCYLKCKLQLLLCKLI